MTITGPSGATTAPGQLHVAVGDEVPVFTLPLTLQRLVMEAGVNRDFTPLHHDDEDTRRTGAPRSYANTMFIQAFIEAGLRTWMGDRGALRELRIRMISFNLAGTLCSTGGLVTRIVPSAAPGEAEVHLDVWVRSDGTLTVTGTAVISIPVATTAPPNSPRPRESDDNAGEDL